MKKLKADLTKHHSVSPSCKLKDNFTLVSKCPKDSENYGMLRVKDSLQLDHVCQLGVQEVMKEHTVKDKIDFSKSKKPFHKIAMILIQFTQTVTNCIEDAGMMEWVLQQDNLVRVPATTAMFSSLAMTQMKHEQMEVHNVKTYSDVLSIPSMMRYTQRRFVNTYSKLADAYAREASACTVGQEWVSVWRKMELLQRDMESMARGVSPASAAMACETWASAGEYHDNPLMRFCSRHRRQQEGVAVMFSDCW